MSVLLNVSPDDYQSYLLVRLRHKIESSKRQLRMLGTRLWPEESFRATLEKEGFENDIQSLLNDVKQDVRVSEAWNKVISEQIAPQKREKMIQELNAQLLNGIQNIKDLEAVFQQVENGENLIDKALLEKIERLLRLHDTSVHEEEVKAVEGHRLKTSRWKSMVDNWHYYGARDYPYYVPFPFHLLSWVARKCVWDPVRDGNELKWLWKQDFSVIEEDFNQRPFFKRLILLAHLCYAILQTTWLISKILLTPFAGLVRLISKGIDKSLFILAHRGTWNPYQLVKPEEEDYQSDKPRLWQNTITFNIITANMERFVAAVAKLARKDVTTPALDTQDNIRAIKAFILSMTKNNQPDVLCLQEMFDTGAQKVMIDALKPIYPYMVYQMAPKHWPFMGSGLMFLSKHPIVDVDFRRFPNVLGDESLANKGVGLIRVRKNGFYFDIVNTHTQAEGSLGFLRTFLTQRRRGDGDLTKRRSVQLGIVAELLKSWSMRKTKDCYPLAQMVAGDLNEPLNTPDKCWGLSSGKSHPNAVGTLKNLGTAQLTQYIGCHFPINFMNVKNRYPIFGAFLKNEKGKSKVYECIQMFSDNHKSHWKIKVVTEDYRVKAMDWEELFALDELKGFWFDKVTLNPPDRNKENACFDLIFSKQDDKQAWYELKIPCRWLGCKWVLDYQGKTFPFENFRSSIGDKLQFKRAENDEHCFIKGSFLENIKPVGYSKGLDPILSQLFLKARQYCPEVFNGTYVGHDYRYQLKTKDTGFGGEVLLDRVEGKVLDPNFILTKYSSIIDTQRFSGIKINTPQTDHKSPDHHPVYAQFQLIPI